MKMFNRNHGIFLVSYTLYTSIVILSFRSHFAHIDPFSNIEKSSEGRHALCYMVILGEIETEDLNDKQQSDNYICASWISQSTFFCTVPHNFYSDTKYKLNMTKE